MSILILKNFGIVNSCDQSLGRLGILALGYWYSLALRYIMTLILFKCIASMTQLYKVLVLSRMIYLFIDLTISGIFLFWG